MAYSEKVLDHYENPRNVGVIEDDQSVGTGMVGAPACGDVMKLQIKVNEAYLEADGNIWMKMTGSCHITEPDEEDKITGKAELVADGELADHTFSMKIDGGGFTGSDFIIFSNWLYLFQYQTNLS